MHRIKTLRTRFRDMETCRNLSGAGWDESTKTVIMEPECLDRWIEDKSFKNAKLRQYVNKPLRHYDDLALIIGDDQATGQFASDAWKKFSRSETINLGDEMNSPMHSPQSTEVHILDDEDTPSPNEAHNTSSSKAKSSSAKALGISFVFRFVLFCAQFLCIVLCSDIGFVHCYDDYQFF
ncbi:uncharacterized protein LOC109846158 [Asparagus officinalis]|uniref:uncharacterized protein LOC109846158 n=1 Tax=Asparagus officinalis TaxID=4686 RepID=UPI00098E3FC6|nr:uncharacterized protein LOC109846158 [Asparagus officinalis]